MYATTKRSLVEMFVDRTAGESTLHNRLITRETESGNVALIAYGWLKLAEYSEERGAVTVFTGHKAIRSKTVSGYLSEVKDVAEERGRDLIISGESPEWDTPNSEVQYINNYISMDGTHSDVELDAMGDVIDSLRHLA